MVVRDRREATCLRRRRPAIFWLPVVDKLRTLEELEPETLRALVL